MREGGEAVKDFIDALHLAVTVWLLFEWYKTQRRLDGTVEALTHLATALFMLTGKPPEKP